ncbi:MAG TPA: FecR family protein, partial [Desulfuromonadaceae bacterium]
MNAQQRYARIFTTFVLALLLAAVWGATDLHAAVIGSLRNVSGPVDIMRGGALPAVAAKNDDQVASGDLVRTKSNGFAEVVYKDGTVLRISERSRVDIGEHFSGNSPNGSEVRLARGKVRAIVDLKNVVAPGAKKFEVRTPNAIAGVRGTDLTVAHQQSTTNVFVQTGTVYSYNPLRPGQIVTLTPGTLTSVTGLNPPTPPRPASPQDIQRMQQGTAPPSGSGTPGGGASGGSGGGTSASGTQGGTSGSASAGGTQGNTGSGGGTSTGATGGTSGTTGSGSTTLGSTTSSTSVFSSPTL